jgi:hypothetical protein
MPTAEDENEVLAGRVLSKRQFDSFKYLRSLHVPLRQTVLT